MHDRLMDEVDEAVRRLGSLIVARCDTPNDLVELVAHHGRGRGRVGRLDIFDHGAPGEQHLGDRVLFRSGPSICTPLEGANIAQALQPHLSDVAQVRLLGCLTAIAPGNEGRFLLWKLARILEGNRVVFGTICEIDVAHFGRNGFEDVLGKSVLFSSLAAIDGRAPTRPCREDHLDELSTVMCL